MLLQIEEGNKEVEKEKVLKTKEKKAEEEGNEETKKEVAKEDEGNEAKVMVTKEEEGWVNNLKFLTKTKLDLDSTKRKKKGAMNYSLILNVMWHKRKKIQLQIKRLLYTTHFLLFTISFLLVLSRMMILRGQQTYKRREEGSLRYDHID